MREEATHSSRWRPPNKPLQQTGLSVASLPLAPAAERRYVGQTGMAEFLTDDRDPPADAPDASPLYRPAVIEHPDEFVRELTGITAPWVSAFGTVRPWFRGMPRISFSLEPSLLRYRP